MPKSPSIVIVVDDDASFRRSTERLLRSAGFDVQTFTKAEEFLLRGRPEGPACLVLDVRLPGISGLELQRRLRAADLRIPIIFVTGHVDVRMTVQAMRAGAADFLTKPFRDNTLLDAVREAVECDRAEEAERAKLNFLRARYDSLTAREREVMAGVVEGRTNKQIAADLGTVEQTIKFHRSNLMAKMSVDSVAGLVRAAGLLDASKKWR